MLLLLLLLLLLCYLQAWQADRSQHPLGSSLQACVCPGGRFSCCKGYSEVTLRFSPLTAAQRSSCASAACIAPLTQQLELRGPLLQLQVPWMEEDLRQRRAKLEAAGGDNLWSEQEPKLHDCPLVMSLREWIEQPTVREVIHNGETLQVCKASCLPVSAASCPARPRRACWVKPHAGGWSSQLLFGILQLMIAC